MQEHWEFFSQYVQKFTKSGRCSNCSLSVCSPSAFSRFSGRVPRGTQSPLGKKGGGRQCRGRPGAPRRAAEAARKLAITKNIRNKKTTKNPLAHSNFLAPTGARQGAPGRPRHRRPPYLMKGFALHPFCDGGGGENAPTNPNLKYWLNSYITPFQKIPHGFSPQGIFQNKRRTKRGAP